MKEILPLVCIPFLLVGRVNANTYTVTNNNSTGAGSFSDAINAANKNPGADTIVFSIAASTEAGRTITPDTTLPHITDAVVIDGTTQTAGTAFGVSNAKIKLDGRGTYDYNGFNIEASNVEIYGIWIYAWGDGIYIGRGGFPGWYNFHDCIIGAAGKGNLINSCRGTGINVDDGPKAIVKGNLVGTDKNGTAADGNGLFGMYLSNTSPGVIVGGTGAGERNVVCGNFRTAIRAYATDTIQGNYVGVGVDGTTAIPNDAYDIAAIGVVWDAAAGSVVRGNIISGNKNYGIEIQSPDVTVQGNYIGTDVTGTVALGNLDGGIFVSGRGNRAIIGGTTNGTRNIISGNKGKGGIFLSGADSCRILGNYIGTDGKGTADLGNSGQGGIYLANGDTGNTIGGTAAGEANVIAYNNYGIYATGSSTIGNDWRNNSIFCSVTGGIKLQSGANNSMAAPVISSAGATGCSGTAPANSRVEIFYDDSCNLCEGKIYIDSASADGSGNWTYSGTLSAGKLAATATRALDGTSEFSACMDVATSIESFRPASGLTVFPNPAATGTVLHIRVPVSDDNCSIALQDLLGRDIAISHGFKQSSGNTVLLDVIIPSSLAPGSYMLIVSSDGIRFLNKMIIQ